MVNQQLNDLRKKISDKQFCFKEFAEKKEEIKTNKKFNIYLVDDNQNDCLDYKNHIQDFDFVNNIKTFNDSLEVLKDLRDLDKNNKPFPQLIIFNVNMPKLNGNQFLEKFKEQFSKKKTKIILFSSFTTEEIQIPEKYNRVIGYLNKPLEGYSLYNILFNNENGLIKSN